MADRLGILEVNYVEYKIPIKVIKEYENTKKTMHNYRNVIDDLEDYLKRKYRYYDSNSAERKVVDDILERIYISKGFHFFGRKQGNSNE